MPKSGSLDRRRARIIGWMIAGKTDREVVALLTRLEVSVSRQAVTAFRKRYRELIAPKQEAIVEATVERVMQSTIAEKAERIRRADIAGTQLMEHIDTHGLVDVVEYPGKNSYTLRRFNHRVVDALVKLQTYVAEELGELPTRAPVVDMRSQRVNIIHVTVEGELDVPEVEE